MKKKYTGKALRIIAMVLLIPNLGLATTSPNAKVNANTDINSKNILSGHVEYSANSTEYRTGDQYEGKIHLTNTAGNVIKAGTKIIASIASDAIDYKSWNFTDSAVSNLFKVEADSITGTITFTLKSDINGIADIVAPFNGTVIGLEGNSYSVSVKTQNIDENVTEVVVNNPQIIIQNDTIPTYGLLNMFWGVEDSNNLTSTYIGKNPFDINDVPTGVFSRTTNDIQNFIEINPLKQNALLPYNHYEVSYEIAPTQNLGSITTNDIEVLDEDAGVVVPPSAYKITKPKNNTLSIIFQSPSESGLYPDGSKIIQSKHKYVINVSSLATSDSDVFISNSKLQIITDDGVNKLNESFELNNVFTDKGMSVVFPNIIAKDKTYSAGQLSNINILTKLTEEVTSTDTIDGDITSNISTNYKDLLDKKDTVGVYPKEVTYSATNSLGYNSTRDITVTIVDKQKAGKVTVNYVDTDSKPIAKTETLMGYIGDNYTSIRKTIKGYSFKEVKGEITAPFSTQIQTVTYVYTKDNQPINPIIPKKDNPVFVEPSIPKAGINDNKVKGELPQTGEDESSELGAGVSGVLTLITSILILIIRRKY